MYRGGQLRDISGVSEMGVTIILQFCRSGPFTHPLSSGPSVDHGLNYILLCNSFVLNGIESIFGTEVLWDDRHQPTTSLLW